LQFENTLKLQSLLVIRRICSVANKVAYIGSLLGVALDLWKPTPIQDNQQFIDLCWVIVEEIMGQQTFSEVLLEILTETFVNIASFFYKVFTSPISPKPTKGKAIAQPKPVVKDAPAAKSTPAKELKLIIKRFNDENPGDTLVKLPKARQKSAINPPSKELVEAAGKQAARRNSLRSAKDPEPGKGITPGTEPVNLKSKSKGLFDTDSAEEELLKETPIPTKAPTQAPTPVEEKTAAATTELPGPIHRRFFYSGVSLGPLLYTNTIWFISQYGTVLIRLDTSHATTNND
jgi:hypothetical protein